MQHVRCRSVAFLEIVLMVGGGALTVTHAQRTPLPNCTGWSDCNPGRGICSFEAVPTLYGSTIIADLPDGLSSDGLGPYRTSPDGVTSRSWVVAGHTSLSPNAPPVNGIPRSWTVNLGHPVPGSGGRPLGTVTVSGDNQLYTAWQRVGNRVTSLLSIPVGETVPAGQINISFHLNGRFHVLQMGPQPLGHCHEASDTRVHGRGTTSGTIHRASPTRWVVDLPAGSVGRLFDVSHTVRHAVDKGLYHMRLRYEITDAMPGVGTVLRPLAESQGGAAVLARHGALKRDSADYYFFSALELLGAGFTLLDSNRPAEALRVFRLAVDEYPPTTNTLGGLGESQLAVGDTVNAIVTLRRAVQLNPENRRAAEALRRLGALPGVALREERSNLRSQLPKPSGPATSAQPVSRKR